IGRAKELTQQLFSFSKSGGEVTKRPTKTKELIEESINLAMSGSSVKCILELDENIWNLYCDPGQINQVLNNILINAKEAMPQGGKVIVRAKNRAISPGEILGLLPGKYVLIEIEDEGAGIPSELMDKIFDPYFTTKGRGSGLGLATVWSIVKKHGGAVLVDSLVNRGTTFFVYLPAYASEIAKECEKKFEVQRQEGRVLVMDDEEELRIVAKEIFEAMGYEVKTANKGEEVLELMEAGEEFDIAVLDLTVKGGMGGLQIVSQVKASGRVKYVLVSTGYATDQVVLEYRNFGFDGAIEKPYDYNKVANVVINLKGEIVQ
ncbi:MAG: ATP-binding protein, partial [Desulfatiglandales bacterium]